MHVFIGFPIINDWQEDPKSIKNESSGVKVLQLIGNYSNVNIDTKVSKYRYPYITSFAIDYSYKVLITNS